MTWCWQMTCEKPQATSKEEEWPAQAIQEAVVQMHWGLAGICREAPLHDGAFVRRKCAARKRAFPALAVFQFLRVWHRSVGTQRHSCAGASTMQPRTQLRWRTHAAQPQMLCNLHSITSRCAGSGGQALLALTLLLLPLALHHALLCCLLSPLLTHHLVAPLWLRAHHPLQQRRQPPPNPPPTMSARGVGAGLRPAQSGPLTATCLC